jgi:hypothetical protein
MICTHEFDIPTGVMISRSTGANGFHKFGITSASPDGRLFTAMARFTSFPFSLGAILYFCRAWNQIVSFASSSALSHIIIS